MYFFVSPALNIKAKIIILPRELNPEITPKETYFLSFFVCIASEKTLKVKSNFIQKPNFL